MRRVVAPGALISMTRFVLRRRELIMRRLAAAIIALALAVPALAQSDDDSRYNIMAPEPWLPPKYKSPRGSTEHVVIPPPANVPQRQPVTPPPLVVPQTGQVLPNLPTIAPSGLQGQETYQDRAARCAHQAGVYGPSAGDRNAYINSCVNQ